MAVDKGTARVVNDSAKNLKIIVATKSHLLITIFSLLWFNGWVIGEVFAIKELMAGLKANDLEIFMVLWVVFWTMTGGFVVGIIIWNSFSQEVITLSGRTLKIKRRVFGLGVEEKYDLKEIKKSSQGQNLNL